MAGKLADFVAQLGSDQEVRDSYSKDPRGTMARFGLDEREQAAMTSGDGERVKEMICSGILPSKPVVGGD